ncbi:response regulator [Natronorubrum daqingense]|uniref:Response regulator n=1 Tax=Natronorubrum daqingense TaxID=588898 RepID=A0A1N6ZT77_9EURY|nr:response regulator [Natronorubrum daqingense]APX95260.1 response regulator [Natronorubrum daqingense]SIR29931.1 Response regulator receiver domain-containing protein [Natronorubrum daqingense]
MSSHKPTEPIDILLVEDNPGDIRLTQEAFKAIQSEIEFHTVTNGEEATRYFDVCETDNKSTNPDLVLLDLNLPRVDGFKVLEILSEQLEYPPPPVLVLSSSETDEDIIKSYDRAANAYLTKPDSPDEFDTLAQAIEDFWIDSARHPPEPS